MKIPVKAYVVITLCTAFLLGSVNMTALAEDTGSYSSDLKYVVNVTAPDAQNDLLTDTRSNAPADDGNAPVASEGYNYVYLGSGNVSQYWATYLHTSKSPDYLEEEPVYTAKDGTAYYLQQTHEVHKRYFVEGLYLDGTMVEDITNTYPAWYSSVFQYVMADVNSGKRFSTYCADLSTPAVKGFSYNLVNLEDAPHYSAEQAAMIRRIASSGYWGAAEGMGSLSAVKELMRNAKNDQDAPLFTEEEINGLTDGVAMTATQYAIWTYSNANNGLRFINTHFIKKDANNENNERTKTLGDIPTEKRASVDVLFKLFEYLIHLEPEHTGTASTGNTVIHNKNFLEAFTIAPKERPETHPHNQDDDKDNDVYVTDLSFTMGVIPDNANGDSLVAKVLDADDNVLAIGQVAGDPQEGVERLETDGKGRFTFSGVELSEGELTCRVTLEGVQNLQNSAFLFTSEKVEDTTSQIMVGVASGAHKVSAVAALETSFKVDEPDPIQVVFSGYKRFDNLVGSEFVFSLAHTNEVLETVRNDAEGYFAFSPIQYTREGFYEYIVTEVPGEDDNILYDPAVYRIAVDVIREGTVLKANTTLYKDDVLWDGEMVFCNESVPPPPEESTPEESTPEESEPEESVPEESTPEESVPEESIPEESIPKNPDTFAAGPWYYCCALLLSVFIGWTMLRKRYTLPCHAAPYTRRRTHRARHAAPRAHRSRARHARPRS